MCAFMARKGTRYTLYATVQINWNERCNKDAYTTHFLNGCFIIFVQMIYVLCIFVYLKNHVYALFVIPSE